MELGMVKRAAVGLTVLGLLVAGSIVLSVAGPWQGNHHTAAVGNGTGITNGNGSIVLARKKSPAQQSCEAAGYYWVEGKGCADQVCIGFDGNVYQPGQTESTKYSDGTLQFWMCDGFTGNMIVVGHTTAGGSPIPTATTPPRRVATPPTTSGNYQP